MAEIQKKKNPLWFLVNTTLVLVVIYFLLLIIVDVGEIVVNSMSGQINNEQAIREILNRNMERINNSGAVFWQFAQPFIRLIILLIILEWVATRIGLEINLNNYTFNWNTQTAIALLIISTFCITTLTGVSFGALENLALVVAGFYFGSQKRIVEYENEREKIKVIEEHENKVEDKNDKGSPLAQKPE